MCAQYHRPDSVRFSLQVCSYSVKPSVPNRALNLLPKDCVRATLVNEIKKSRPHVPFVVASFSFAGDGEWLAGAGSGPDRSVGGPSGQLKSQGPSSDSREEVALGVFAEFMGFDFRY
jgi:hypothetical protein